MQSWWIRVIAVIGFTFLCLVPINGQDKRSGPEAAVIKASPAYSEILLRRTELRAEIDAMSADYTENNPKMMDLRNELAALDRETDRVFAVRAADAGKLTLALGKLIVRKAALDADLARLTRTYSRDHPDVKRAQRRVEIFENSIAEVLK